MITKNLRKKPVTTNDTSIHKYIDRFNVNFSIRVNRSRQLDRITPASEFVFCRHVKREAFDSKLCGYFFNCHCFYLQLVNCIRYAKLSVIENEIQSSLQILAVGNRNMYITGYTINILLKLNYIIASISTLQIEPIFFY